MPDAALLEACHSLFSHHDLVTATAKGLLLEPNGPKGADPTRAAEVRAAVDLLHDCLISGTGAGNPGRLAKAEEICHREIQRPVGSPNGAGLQARARFVLAAINYMRGEPEVCAANIAHAYAAEPRWCRGTFSDVFQSAFRPACSSLYHRLKQGEAKARAKSYVVSMLAIRAVAVGVGVGIIGMTLFFGGKGAGVFRLGWNAAKPIWQAAACEHRRKAQLARVRQHFEEQLDQTCRSIALRML